MSTTPDPVRHYSDMIRRTDKAVKSLFEGFRTVTPDGQVCPVPCIWANEEHAVASFTGPLGAVNTDNIRLPIVAVHNTRLQPEPYPEHERGPDDPIQVSIRYQVVSYSLYRKDANQIIERAMSVLAPEPEIDQGNGWVTKVHLTHIDLHGVIPEVRSGPQIVSRDTLVVYAEVNFRRKEVA